MPARDYLGFTCARCTALRYGWCRCHLDGSPFARALDLAAAQAKMSAMPNAPAFDTQAIEAIRGVAPAKR